MINKFYFLFTLQQALFHTPAFSKQLCFQLTVEISRQSIYQCESCSHKKDNFFTSHNLALTWKAEHEGGHKTEKDLDLNPAVLAKQNDNPPHGHEENSKEESQGHPMTVFSRPTSFSLLLFLCVCVCSCFTHNCL